MDEGMIDKKGFIYERKKRFLHITLCAPSLQYKPFQAIPTKSSPCRLHPWSKNNNPKIWKFVEMERTKSWYRTENR